MASANLFEFQYSPSISPIACALCGHDMHCVRRSPQENGEKQMFMCATCGECTDRIVGGQSIRGALAEAAEAALPAFLIRELANRRSQP